MSEREGGSEDRDARCPTPAPAGPDPRDVVAGARERRVVQGGVETLVFGAWADRFPGLVHGVTLRTTGRDFGTDVPGPDRRQNEDPWDRLRQAVGMGSAVRCRQVHGDRVVSVGEPVPGVSLLGDADGLVTRRRGILLTVTVADCVPVFALEPSRGILGLAHAGWRGLAAGVIESLIDRLVGLGATPESIRLYCGPGICGGCYEVGPEVPRALGLSDQKDRVDLGALIIQRAEAAGLPADGIRRSRLCTLESRDVLCSYRGGDVHARMCAFLGRSAR